MVINQFASTADASTGIVTSIIFLLTTLVFAAALIGIFVIWVLTLIHVIQHEDVPDRVLWIVLHFLVGSIIGPIYWLVVKKPYDKKHPK